MGTQMSDHAGWLPPFLHDWRVGPAYILLPISRVIILRLTVACRDTYLSDWLSMLYLHRLWLCLWSGRSQTWRTVSRLRPSNSGPALSSWGIVPGWGGGGHCLFEGRYPLPNYRPCFSALAVPHSFFTAPYFWDSLTTAPLDTKLIYKVVF